MKQGKIIIISAPSGCGKSTIINRLMTHTELHLAFSISCTSRPPRGNERHGTEYFFLTENEFRAHIAAGDFLEYEEVYAGRFYGTLREQVERQTHEGYNVVVDVDVKGGSRIKAYYGERALSLFIMPPSLDTLRRRLVLRGTDSADVIAERIARAEFEMTFAERYDHVIVNDDVEVAQKAAYDAILTFINA